MRIHETLTTEGMGPDRVDREAGIIRGVRILGRQSSNGRRYSDRAMEQACMLYEGRKVNIDHSLSERKFAEGFGEFRKVVLEGSGDARLIRGDLYYLKSHPMSAIVIESAERFPTQFGISHDAEGKVTGSKPHQIVEELEKVHSLDVVGNPATNRGLFESHQDGDEAVEKKSITAILMEAAKSEARKTPEYKLLHEMMLREMDGEMSMPSEVAVEPDMKPEEQIKSGILGAITAALEKADVATLKKVMKTVGLGDPLEAAAGGGSENPNPDNGASDGSATADTPRESEEVVRLKVQLAEQQKRSAAVSALVEASIPATPARTKAYAACETDAERKELVESWKGGTDKIQKPKFSRPMYDPEEFKGDDYSKLKESAGERLLL